MSVRQLIEGYGFGERLLATRTAIYATRNINRDNNLFKWRNGLLETVVHNENDSELVLVAASDDRVYFNTLESGGIRSQAYSEGLVKALDAIPEGYTVAYVSSDDSYLVCKSVVGLPDILVDARSSEYREYYEIPVDLEPVGVSNGGDVFCASRIAPLLVVWRGDNARFARPIHPSVRPVCVNNFGIAVIGRGSDVSLAMFANVYPFNVAHTAVTPFGSWDADRVIGNRNDIVSQMVPVSRRVTTLVTDESSTHNLNTVHNIPHATRAEWDEHPRILRASGSIQHENKRVRLGLLYSPGGQHSLVELTE